MRQFVLLATPRTGSTFLRIWLNHHSRINSHGEVFLRRYESPDGFRRFCLDSSLSRRARFLLHHCRLCKIAGIDLITAGMIEDYLKRLHFDRSHPGPWTELDQRHVVMAKKSASVSGFKLMYRTLERHAAIRTWLDGQPEVSILHLRRSNLLKSFVSIQRLRQTKVAHTTVALSYAPVVVEIDKLRDYFENTNARRQLYRKKYSARHPYLELGYEEMLNDIAATRKKVLEFFSLSPESMPVPATVETGSSELRKEVANYREVIDALTGTEYERFLSEFVW